MKKLSVTITILLLLIFLGIFSYNTFFKREVKSVKNIILIGWDGTQRDHLYELLDDGKLPNLSKLIKEGSIVDTEITTAETDTKPGWSEILTGYGPEITGVYSNFDYKPIPKGYTIFERLEDYFGKDNIVTMFIGGKINNIGARGPHKICVNCMGRYPDTLGKTRWWEETTKAPTRRPGEERVFEKREGEPYYYAKEGIDVFLTELGAADNVGPEVLRHIEKYKDQRFFAFFHFEEPDEVGHRYGENSKEYSEGIITDDQWLGEIISKLKKVGIYEETVVYVTADHGFDEGTIFHSHAPYTFLATNNKEVTKDGDRKDITPTILWNYGFDVGNILPTLQGEVLISRE